MAPDPHGTKSQDVCGIYGLEIRPFSAPERPSRNEVNYLWKAYEDLGVSRISGPVSPCYSTYNSRIKTFDNWTIPDIQSPEKLAEAGFYYTLVQDNVLCFHCGGGLKNWEVDDDPWVEHARWFSRCGFVLLQKGRDFVNDVLAKSVGFTTPEAMGEIKMKCELNNAKPQQEEKEANNKIEKKAESKVEKKEKSSSTTEATTNTASTSTSTADKQNQSSSNSDLKEIELCRICYTREREIVFLPCGHFVSCPQCAPSLSTCAVCRKPFEAVVRAYLS